MNLRPEILLHPNIPKPLHGLAPRTILGQEWWNKQRQIAYAKTDYHCMACGTHKSKALFYRWLEAHELYDLDYAKGRMTMREIVALCHACHNYIHSGRMRAMVKKGQMSAAKEALILAHGDTILKAAKLRKPELPINVAAWKDWRLILDGIEYKGRFASLESWRNYYE